MLHLIVNNFFLVNIELIQVINCLILFTTPIDLQTQLVLSFSVDFELVIQSAFQESVDHLTVPNY